MSLVLAALLSLASINGVLHSGWTVFEKLYIYKGIPYIITKTPEAVPDIQFIISKGVPIHSSKVDDPERLPTEADLKVVSPSEAKAIFGGSSAQVLDGNSVRLFHSRFLILIPLSCPSFWSMTHLNCMLYPIWCSSKTNICQHNTLLPLVCRTLVWFLAYILLSWPLHLRTRQHNTSTSSPSLF